MTSQLQYSYLVSRSCSGADHQDYLTYPDIHFPAHETMKVEPIKATRQRGYRRGTITKTAHFRPSVIVSNFEQNFHRKHVRSEEDRRAHNPDVYVLTFQKQFEGLMANIEYSPGSKPGHAKMSYSFLSNVLFLLCSRLNPL